MNEEVLKAFLILLLRKNLQVPNAVPTPKTRVVQVKKEKEDS